MRIVFDAYWWDEGPPSLRHVEREIILAWHDSFPDDELILVLRRNPENRHDGMPEVPYEETSLWPQAFAATLAVSRAARIHHADAVVTHNFAAWLPNVVSTVCLHDVLFTTNPEWFTAIERRYFSLMSRWVKRADVVFTSSRAEATRIQENSNARLVLPVGLGLSTELMDDPEENPDPSLTPGSFVLTVGRLNVRKNLERIIHSALDTGRFSPEYPLVVAGGAGGRAATVSARTTRAVESGSVVFTGFVSEARLRWLYNNTALFVFLPLDEGFGMPPVEAAYFDAPILASDLDVFHENLGDWARFVRPTDENAIATAMSEALNAADSSLGRASHADEMRRKHDWVATVGAMRAVIADRLQPVSA